MKLDWFSQEHMNSTISTKSQQSSAVLESHQEHGVTSPGPQHSFHSLLHPKHKFLFQTKTAHSICNKCWSLPAWLLSLYLKNISFQRIKHPSEEWDLQGPWFLVLQWNGLWEKLRTPMSQGSLTPCNKGPQAHPWLPSQVCFCQTQVILALEMFRWWDCAGVWWVGILPSPAVTWKT